MPLLSADSLAVVGASHVRYKKGRRKMHPSTLPLLLFLGSSLTEIYAQGSGATVCQPHPPSACLQSEVSLRLSWSDSRLPVSRKGLENRNVGFVMSQTLLGQ